MDKDPCKTREWQKTAKAEAKMNSCQIIESKKYKLIHTDQYGHEKTLGCFNEKWTAEQVKKLFDKIFECKNE